jgi:hypothetical protein
MMSGPAIAGPDTIMAKAGIHSRTKSGENKE